MGGDGRQVKEYITLIHRMSSSSCKPPPRGGLHARMEFWVDFDVLRPVGGVCIYQSTLLHFLYLDFRLNSMGSTPRRLVQHYNRNRIRGLSLLFPFYKSWYAILT